MHDSDCHSQLAAYSKDMEGYERPHSLISYLEHLHMYGVVGVGGDVAIILSIIQCVDFRFSLAHTAIAVRMFF